MNTPLRTYLSSKNRPIEAFVHWRSQHLLDLSPPYQRGDVWGIKRRANFIRSLSFGVPVPSIIISDRLDHENGGYVVIDGKQRISTLLLFVDNAFAVPADWFQENARGFTVFSDLPIPERRKFLHKGIPTHEGRFDSIESEKLVFDLINFGGLQQGEVDSDLIEAPAL